MVKPGGHVDNPRGQVAKPGVRRVNPGGQVVKPGVRGVKSGGQVVKPGKGDLRVKLDLNRKYGGDPGDK